MLKIECVLTGVAYANLVADYFYLFLFSLFPSSDFCFSKVTHPPHIASDTKLVLKTHEIHLSILNTLAKFKPHSAWMRLVANDTKFPAATPNKTQLNSQSWNSPG